MSESGPRVDLDDGPDDREVFVVDPDDYAKTRKLKSINDAKDHVRKLRKEMPETASQIEWDGIHSRIASAVATYGSELLPLIEDAIEQGLLSESIYQTETGSLREFIHYDGRLPNSEHEGTKPGVYMMMYRQLGRIQRELGLGLEIKEDQGPAQI